MTFSLSSAEYRKMASEKPIYFKWKIGTHDRGSSLIACELEATVMLRQNGVGKKSISMFV